MGSPMVTLPPLPPHLSYPKNCLLQERTGWHQQRDQTTRRCGEAVGWAAACRPPAEGRFSIMRSTALQEGALCMEQWGTVANPLSICGQESSAS